MTLLHNDIHFSMYKVSKFTTNQLYNCRVTVKSVVNETGMLSSNFSQVNGLNSRADWALVNNQFRTKKDYSKFKALGMGLLTPACKKTFVTETTEVTLSMMRLWSYIPQGSLMTIKREETSVTVDLILCKIEFKTYSNFKLQLSPFCR